MIKMNKAFPLSSKTCGQRTKETWTVFCKQFQSTHRPRPDTQIFYSTEVISISPLQPAQKHLYSMARKCYSLFIIRRGKECNVFLSLRNRAKNCHAF